jgi:hypothetical protein
VEVSVTNTDAKSAETYFTFEVPAIDQPHDLVKTGDDRDNYGDGTVSFQWECDTNHPNWQIQRYRDGVDEGFQDWWTGGRSIPLNGADSPGGYNVSYRVRGCNGNGQPITDWSNDLLIEFAGA